MAVRTDPAFAPIGISPLLPSRFRDLGCVQYGGEHFLIFLCLVGQIILENIFLWENKLLKIEENYFRNGSMENKLHK